MALLQVALGVLGFLQGILQVLLRVLLLRVSHALQPRSSVPMAAR